jgi:hypothetical protein
MPDVANESAKLDAGPRHGGVAVGAGRSWDSAFSPENNAGEPGAVAGGSSGHCVGTQAVQDRPGLRRRESASECSGLRSPRIAIAAVTEHR